MVFICSDYGAVAGSSYAQGGIDIYGRRWHVQLYEGQDHIMPVPPVKPSQHVGYEGTIVGWEAFKELYGV